MNKLPIDYIPMSKRDKHSREKILECAAHWVVTGSLIAVERQTGVSRKTVNYWRKAEWWEPLIDAIRADKSDELDARLTGLIHRAADEVADRLEGGEYRRDKNDEIVRVPVSARDAMMISAIAFDKRQINRNLPTSISENASDRLKMLQAQLAAVSGRVIDVTPTKVD